MPEPTALQQLARAEAQAIAAEIEGVRAVVIATVDGFDIASSASGGTDAQRIAALASSIAAIGQVVATEAGLGRGTSVTVNTASGFALVHSVRRADTDLVIHVVAGEGALLAQVNYRAAEAVRRLEAA